MLTEFSDWFNQTFRVSPDPHKTPLLLLCQADALWGEDFLMAGSEPTWHTLPAVFRLDDWITLNPNALPSNRLSLSQLERQTVTDVLALLEPAYKKMKHGFSSASFCLEGQLFISLCWHTGAPLALGRSIDMTAESERLNHFYLPFGRVPLFYSSLITGSEEQGLPNAAKAIHALHFIDQLAQLPIQQHGPILTKAHKKGIFLSEGMVNAIGPILSSLNEQYALKNMNLAIHQTAKKTSPRL